MRARKPTGGGANNGYYGGNASYGGGGGGYGSGGSNNNAYSYSGYGNTTNNLGGGLGGGSSSSSSSSSYSSGMPLYASASSKKGYNNNNRGSGNNLYFILSCTFAIVCTIIALYQRSSYNSFLVSMDNSKNIDDAYSKLKSKRQAMYNAKDRARLAAREISSSQRTLADFQTKSKNYDTEILNLEEDHEDIIDETQELQYDHEDIIDEKEDMLYEISKSHKYQSKREKAWKEQVYILQNATQRDSYRMVIERFGNGPYHVEFTIQLTKEEEAKFKVEMAPLGLVPHAVHLFLEQVYHELWDLTYFFVNGPHVLQAGPYDYFLNDDEVVQFYEEDPGTERFKKAKLDKLTFPDYSPEFPHKTWTLGFTGRPGGPDFYINKLDNMKHHGPHGQNQYGLEEQADSCFAKVIEGQNVLYRVFGMETYGIDSMSAHMFKEPIEILSARIVGGVVQDKIIKGDEVMKKKKKTGTSTYHARRNIKNNYVDPKLVKNNQEMRDDKLEKKVRELKDKEHEMEVVW